VERLLVPETERLRLHPWTTEFTPALARVNADPEAMRFITGGVPMSAEETAVQSAYLAAHWNQYGFGLWAVEVKASGDVVGFTGLSHPRWFPELADEVEVGWRLLPSAWGHGYATEAATEALRTAFDDLALDHVISLIDPANTRSSAVAVRLGLHVDRITPHPERPADVAIYTTSRHDRR
jgi:RimJ/RimL family protein N-acetyltransferase